MPANPSPELRLSSAWNASGRRAGHHWRISSTATGPRGRSELKSSGAIKWLSAGPACHEGPESPTFWWLARSRRKLIGKSALSAEEPTGGLKASQYGRSPSEAAVELQYLS